MPGFRPLWLDVVFPGECKSEKYQEKMSHEGQRSPEADSRMSWIMLLQFNNGQVLRLVISPVSLSFVL